MDVGQVKFTIIADGLDDTIGKVGALQDSLNSMDGRTYRRGASRRLRDETAYNRAVQRSLRNQKQLINQTQRRADMYHKQSEKRIKDAMKFAKINARNRAYAERMEKEQYAQREKFQKNWETRLARGGARMQTLGATLQNITSPFTNVYRGLAMGVGYRALGKIMDSISGAFSRYDTMKNYDKLLKELGIDTTKKFTVGTGKAQSAIDNLEQSVLGLPTGLDEIVSAMRTYAGATGDVEKATKLAIAANNAYIAGGMDARQQLFTQRQLLSLAGGAELSSNQWDSLRRNAPLAIKAVADKMKMSVQDMIDKLKEGEMSGQKFLDAFINVGTQGKLSSAAQKMKQTWSAVSQNITNALNRAGEGVLSTLDDVFKKMDGRTFLQHVLGIDKNGKDIGGGIRGLINDISKSAQEWIKANPEKITGLIDNISKIDWKGMASGFAEFGLTIGRFYSGLAKQFGGKGLVNLMLWGNVAGKGIQIAGGLTKGLAGPVSKLLTLFKFGAGGRAIKGAKDLAKNHGALIGATKTVSGMALTWQDVASKAVSVAAIPAMAWSLREIALAFQEFDKVDIGWGELAGKITQAAGAVTAFGGLAAVFGWIMTGATGKLLGKITLLTEGAGLLAITGISKVMKSVGEGLNAIADADIPSVGKITQVAEAMAEIGTAFEAKNPFEAIGIIFDSWAKSSEFKAITKVTDAFRSMKELSKIKINPDQMSKARENFANLKIFIDDLETMFDESEATEREQSGATTGANAYGNTNKYSNYKTRMSSFADTIKAVSDGLGNMQQLVTNANNLQKMYSGLQTHGRNEFDWGVVGRQMKSIADGMYQLIDGGEESPVYKLKQLSNQTKGMNLDYVLSTLKLVPQIIKKMQEIGNIDTASVNTGNLDSLGDKINTFVTKISGAFSRAGSGFGGVSGMAMSAGSFLAGVTAVKKAINKMNSIPVAKDMSAIVSSVQTAVDQLNSIGTRIITINITIQGGVTDMVTPAITATKDAIDRAMKSIKDQKKSVNVKINLGASTDNVTPYINRVASNIRAAINRIPSSVNKTVSVNVNPGYNDPLGLIHNPIAHGGTVHRANGGIIPRGTDSVPALLTPGEYVLKRRAASMLGHTLLNRLNHLDIRGALSELSARASQRSSVVSTTNNTKNISLTMNNNGSANIGLNRTSGWLNRL